MGMLLKVKIGAMSDNSFTFAPVTSERWKDLEKLFESKGAPHYCWCLVWRKKTTGSKKKQLQENLRSYKYIGLLGYHLKNPVAWCSVAPRETYKELSGVDHLSNVWSLVCFFIKRPYRGRGLTTELLKASLEFAKNHGADYLEAYPVDKYSPSYRFMGFKPTFERAGFEFCKKAGSRRNVMIKAL